jgi:hypothetical protein
MGSWGLKEQAPRVRINCSCFAAFAGDGILCYFDRIGARVIESDSIGSFARAGDGRMK